MKIKEMSLAERPREKLLEKGPAALSDGELIAILLGSGTREESVLDIARKMLRESGGRLQDFFAMSASEMMTVKGIGPNRAAVVQAAVELGRRFFEESSLGTGVIHTPEQACKLMLPRFKGIDHEECWAVYLSKNNSVIGREKICIGSMDSTVIDSRRIIKNGLDRKAYSLILYHNHPSGNPAPSKADISQTNVLNDACKAVSIKLLDHIIVGDERYFSFSEGETLGMRTLNPTLNCENGQS